jgi:membrane-associated phospholipid phosphatase
LIALARAHALPLAAITILAVVTELRLGVNPAFTGTSPLEIASHHIGHELNSIWVGIGLLAIVIPSIVALAQRKADPWVWRVLDAILLDFLVVDAFCRRFLRWPRPNNIDRAGFPSGHALFAFLVAYLIWRRYPKLGPLWFTLATIVAWSRVISNAHYPYQVICGATFGCVLGWLITHRPHGVLFPRLFLRQPAVEPARPTVELGAEAS